VRITRIARWRVRQSRSGNGRPLGSTARNICHEPEMGTTNHRSIAPGSEPNLTRPGTVSTGVAAVTEGVRPELAVPDGAGVHRRAQDHLMGFPPGSDTVCR
jgi:hypothetical protein